MKNQFIQIQKMYFTYNEWYLVKSVSSTIIVNIAKQLKSSTSADLRVLLHDVHTFLCVTAEIVSFNWLGANDDSSWLFVS